MQLRKHVHGTRTTVLWFEGPDNTSWTVWSTTIVRMLDSLARSSDFKLFKTAYRGHTGVLVTEGVEFEWSNGRAAIWSDVPHEVVIVFDSTLKPRKAEGLMVALMACWADI